MVNKLTKAQEKRLRKVLVKNTRLIDGVFAIPTSLYSNVIDDIAKELFDGLIEHYDNERKNL